MAKKRTYEPPMRLDMPFREALERFIGTDPKEMQANMAKAKKRKPPGSKPPGGDSQDAVSLRDRRMRKRNQGR